jgi:hypothetical protein
LIAKRRIHASIDKTAVPVLSQDVLQAVHDLVSELPRGPPSAEALAEKHARGVVEANGHGDEPGTIQEKAAADIGSGETVPPKKIALLAGRAERQSGQTA